MGRELDDETIRHPRPGPDYVEKVRELGLLAVLLILGWALAGYPAIHGHALPVARRLISTGWPYVVGWVVFAYALWELELRLARDRLRSRFPGRPPCGSTTWSCCSSGWWSPGSLPGSGR